MTGAGTDVPMAVRCSRCGGPGPTRPVHLHRHIGLVVLFFHTRIRGELCRACLDVAFRDAFLVTLVAGWWGIVSFFATAFFLPFDLAQYLLTRASYGSAETPSSSGTRTALSAVAGALPLFGVLCGGPYLLLAGLASLAGGAHGSPDAGAASHTLSHVCDGDASTSAPAYDATQPIVAVGYRQTDEGWTDARDYVPGAWRTDALVAPVVVCVDRERVEVVEQCVGVDAHRTTYPRGARLVEAGTARELGRTSVIGADAPAPCPSPATSTSGRSITLSGARVQPAEVSAALVALAARGFDAPR